MTDLDTRRPEFATSLRGYDRVQVDDYIDRLQTLLRHAEERTRAAELTDPEEPQLAVGPRLSRILELATEEAREMRARGRQEAVETVEEARERAETMLNDAEQTARTTAEQAEDRHGEQLREYANQRARMEADLAELEAHKEAVITEILRLRDALGAAPGLSGAPALAEAAATDLMERRADADTPRPQLEAPESGQAVEPDEDATIELARPISATAAERWDRVREGSGAGRG